MKGEGGGVLLVVDTVLTFCDEVISFSSSLSLLDASVRGHACVYDEYGSN